MHTKSILVVIAGSLLLAATAAIAATVILKGHFKGKAAFTVCSTSETITCADGFSGELFTDVFVEGSEFSSKTNEFPTEAQNNAFATFRQFNTCTDEFSAAFGSLPGGFSDRGLMSADVAGTFPLTTFEGEPFGTIGVDVTMEGFGDIVTDRDRIRFEFGTDEGLVVVAIKVKGKTRSATPSGTITLDGNQLPCAFGEATLTDTKNGSREVLH